MWSHKIIRPLRISAGFAVALALTGAATAQGTDPVFPPGSRVGLVPPAGMAVSDTFPGFVDAEKKAAILVTALPADAYAQIEKTLDPEVLKKQGVSIEKRETIELKIGKGLLITGRQVAEKEHYRRWLLIAAAGNLTALISAEVPLAADGYPDDVVRAALATLSVRKAVPEKEQLSLLPFEVGELAGFHIDGVLRGRALMLSDMPNEGSDGAPAEPPPGGVAAHLLVAALPGGPAEPDDRANFARLAFNDIPGIKDVHITVLEPLRIGGQPGYQTLAEAKDLRTGTEVMVVQWLRFGIGGFMQMVGVGPASTWPGVLSRLRMVRDSIGVK